LVGVMRVADGPPAARSAFEQALVPVHLFLRFLQRPGTTRRSTGSPPGATAPRRPGGYRPARSAAG
jgi:hypothetical protein